jgi:uncharacterized protein (TIGR02996 family)
MGVFFVCRSPYEGPSGKRVRRFADPTVLDWFRNRWEPLAEAGSARRRVREWLDGPVYGFASLFEAIAEEQLPPPATPDQLFDYLEGYLYLEGPLICQPYLIQCLTNDDELELAWFFLDDQFLAEEPRRAAYLLYEDWWLPAGSGPGGFTSGIPTCLLDTVPFRPGTTYLAIVAYYDSSNLIDLPGAMRIEGLRLAELPGYLLGLREEDRERLLTCEMDTLRTQLVEGLEAGAPGTEGAFLRAIRGHPGDDTNWLVYADWLQDQGRPSPATTLLERALAGVSENAVPNISGQQQRNDPAHSLIRVDDHLAQLCLHTDTWGEQHLYHQWTFFDDLWAGAHPALATASSTLPAAGTCCRTRKRGPRTRSFLTN